MAATSPFRCLTGDPVDREPPLAGACRTGAIGLFVAINDFTDGAIETHSRVGAAMILMGGEDLYAILEGRYALPEVLHRKRRHAFQTGDIYIRVRDF
jgi:hypothetical protein